MLKFTRQSLTGFFGAASLDQLIAPAFVWAVLTCAPVLTYALATWSLPPPLWVGIWALEVAAGLVIAGLDESDEE